MDRLLTLFVHYDPDNRISNYIVFHLRKLQEISSHLVFITTSQPNGSELSKLSGIVSEIVIQPENVGFDFYGWSSYLKTHRTQVESYDAVLLTNSSIIGPLFSLPAIIDKMSSYLYWGLTDSYQIGYHLQSYFLFFQKEVVRTQSFWDFFENIIPFPSVDSVIQSYEVNLTTYFMYFFGKPGVLALGEQSFLRRPMIKLLSFQEEKIEDWMLLYKQFWLFKYFQVRDPVNPCFYFPDQLLDQKFPYIKVKLLKDNHYKRNLSRIMSAIVAAGIDISDMNL